MYAGADTQRIAILIMDLTSACSVPALRPAPATTARHAMSTALVQSPAVSGWEHGLFSALSKRRLGLC